MNVHVFVLLTNSFLNSWFQSPAKAVYNARHWNQPEPEEMPVPPLSRSQTAPVRYYYIISIVFGVIMLCVKRVNFDVLKLSFEIFAFILHTQHYRVLCKANANS